MLGGRLSCLYFSVFDCSLNVLIYVICLLHCTEQKRLLKCHNLVACVFANYEIMSLTIDFIVSISNIFVSVMR